MIVIVIQFVVGEWSEKKWKMLHMTKGPTYFGKWWHDEYKSVGDICIVQLDSWYKGLQELPRPTPKYYLIRKQIKNVNILMLIRISFFQPTFPIAMVLAINLEKKFTFQGKQSSLQSYHKTDVSMNGEIWPKMIAKSASSTKVEILVLEIQVPFQSVMIRKNMDTSTVITLWDSLLQVQCLKITEKVSFNTESEASYIYNILSRQMLVENAKNDPF